WHRFSGLTFAKALNSSDSVPRITFGRTYEDEGKLLLPVAIQVHHGLVDGLHVARFLEAFQQRLTD
ncbi:MAG TPA: CatA-like O-acetyltransferase, partial [Candidatus Rifleibacterium sp.]|nr:CatA-like O-acetyltransferase [Candidatus Rifleibacterium sp.]